MIFMAMNGRVPSFFRQREPRLVESGAERAGNMAREPVHPIGRVKRAVPLQAKRFIWIVSDKSGWYRGHGSPLFGTGAGLFLFISSYFKGG